MKTVWRPGSVACSLDGIISGVLADKGWLVCADQDRSPSVNAARIAALAAQLAALSKNEI